MSNLTELARRIDPVCMAEACAILADPWQRKLLKSQAKQIMLLCSRQVGKSTATALIAVHTARYQPGAQILLLAPSERQSQELLRQIALIWHRLDTTVTAKADTLTRMEMSNGSRILALPGSKGDSIRGLSSVSLAVFDEAARVQIELVIAARPMLAVSGGRLILLSSAAGARGWFYEEWKHGHDYQRFEVRADECPRISKEFLASERRALGPHFYAQEYENAWLDATSSVFRTSDIEAMITDKEKVWSIPPMQRPEKSMVSR